jgi:flagellar biosynthesis/type III secretory pathway chaperone
MISTNMDMESIQERMTALEDLLVKEFRACQALHALTREERQALATGKIEDLMKLIEQKEVRLDEMGEIEGKRRVLIQELNRLYGLKPETSTLADLTASLPEELSGRLRRLGEGIFALLVDVRDLTQGNRAIASNALERADAIQAFLLNLYHRPGGYRPGESLPGADSPASRAA